MKLLLANSKVNPSDNNNWAIQAASQNGHPEVMKLLLTDQRVEQSFARAPTGPSDYDNYAIQEASRFGYLDVVKLLSTLLTLSC